ncbi:MAG: bifunctional diaminohydroxyphosphoribosylaminopyrimidine deaminase/5-amino-6-(5-phosphoribosylamino)uracil reductase RibD [Candidatus Omnitrophica bacterium]|nr:bifunctional diaminohydroxyphosphoribosylaminopyrimidine deaminase/5-amino-6-(5-phosphoribosylamino)uracil reductase RibD [Candidatus Omnitrophota bacterium]MDE2221850.1 bifunctional diaminohydroxyphosphoribosylaminopyrimidine deaminase/5-amino-6-(5-phosphoribosylamino)uracil reductase RibD [Candidatus Omnitrophota bacterium]
MNNDIIYMNRAWELALQGWGRTSPNPMVGAVIVKSGRIIAEGYHHYCGADHAEVDAFKKAGTAARGAALYVTLEPCGHWGRTPPCTEAIVKAGIRKVVVGALDPNKLNNGQSLKFLRRNGIKVEQGLLSEELTRLNEAFNCWITKKRPMVTVKIAQTLDGKIATLNGRSQWITAAFARNYAHRLRFGFDAIMVGINTVLKDGPRLNTVPAKPIKKIILDTHGRFPARARLCEGTRPQDVLVFTGKAAMKRADVQVIEAPLYEGKIDLKWVLSFLGKMDITSVLIEGGGLMAGEALRRNLADKMMIYMAPKIMGEGLGSVRGFVPKALGEIAYLKEMSIDKIGEDILIQGYPHVYRHR